MLLGWSAWEDEILLGLTTEELKWKMGLSDLEPAALLGVTVDIETWTDRGV